MEVQDEDGDGRGRPGGRSSGPQQRLGSWRTWTRSTGPPPQCPPCLPAGPRRGAAGALTRERGAGSFTETELGEIKFPDISAPVLEKVCQYFYYKLKYMNRCAALPAAGPAPSFLPPGGPTDWPGTDGRRPASAVTRNPWRSSRSSRTWPWNC